MEKDKEQKMKKWKCIAWGGRIEIRAQDNSETGIAFLGNNEEDRALPSKKVRENAYLMSSAPELLEALKELIGSDLCDREIFGEEKKRLPEYEIFIHKCRQVIAKAEGR